MRSLVGLVFLASMVACTMGGGGGGGGGDDDGDDDVTGGPDAGTTLGPCDPPAFTTGVSTLAGCGEAAWQDGPRDQARFANPVNVVEGPDGLLYVADFDGGAIRVVDPDGNVETLVRQDGFSRPFGLTFVGSTLYVSTDDDDQGAHSSMTGTVWKVNTSTGAATVVARDVGRPRGLLALPDGRIAMSDYQHHALRILTPSSGAIEPLAGSFDHTGMTDATGAAARFNAPVGMGLLPDGSIVVADVGNDRIRRVTMDGAVSTFAGRGTAGHADGPAATASFDQPQAVTVGAGGEVYLTDMHNHVIRSIIDGQVATVAGDHVAGWRDDDDPTAAELYGIEGLGISGDGLRLWVADGSGGEPVPYNRIRIVELR